MIGAAPLSYRVAFEGGSGFSLAGIVDRPEPLDGSPVLVFSHCFTCNKDLKAIVRISRALADLGIAVLRYDMTGLGGSEGDFSRTDFSANCRDLISAIQFSSIELGPVTALMGHSFGGAASMHVAGKFPNACPDLGALISLAAPSDTTHLALLLDRMNPDIERKGAGEVSIGGRNWTIRREMLADFRSHAIADSISQIQQPLLILHSPSDETVSYDHALRIMGLMEDRASLISLKGGDHLLSNESADLNMAAQMVAAFLHRHARQQA